MGSMVSYFTIPKALDKDLRYKDLSVEAKYLYGHMRDTLKLSIKNGWKDGKGYFIRMTRDKIAALLKRSLPTVRRIIRELIAVGLLREKREGLTRSNRLYVQLLPSEDISSFTGEGKQSSLHDGKQDFSTDRKPVASNNRNSISPYFSRYGMPKAEQYKAKYGHYEGEVYEKDGTKWTHSKGYEQRFYEREALESLFEVK